MLSNHFWIHTSFNQFKNLINSWMAARVTAICVQELGITYMYLFQACTKLAWIFSSAWFFICPHCFIILLPICILYMQYILSMYRYICQHVMLIKLIRAYVYCSISPTKNKTFFYFVCICCKNQNKIFDRSGKMKWINK